MFVVKEINHYSKLLFRHSNESPLFKVGNSLPENILRLLGFDREHWDTLTWDGVKAHNEKLIRSGNYSFKHYHEIKGKIPGEEVCKEFFDDMGNNDANDSCHTIYIKYLPSYVAACSILSNLKTN